MSVLLKYSRLSRGCRYPKKPEFMNGNTSYCTIAREPKPRSLLKMSLLGVTVGVAASAGYYYQQVNEARKNFFLEGKTIEVETLKYKPPVSISRKVISPVDTTGLKLTLFQYQTCPFCCKVRVFLDYYGLSYDVVEVDPVLRREISWSSYKKVPILLAKTPEGYRPLNDSSMIVSLLGSHLNDRSYSMEELSKCYPNIGVHDDNGKFKQEILNKYYLMYNKGLPSDKSMDDVMEERKWRMWADDTFVHTLSPNVYRTLGEAYETFNWFKEVGKWEEYFPAWERAIIINVGALGMWMVAKRLKKRHNLKDDVRQALYDEAKYWLKNVHARGGTFMGGDKPDLSDLAVYGALKSIEGCTAFKDLMRNTNMGVWYEAVAKEVQEHAGSKLLPTALD